MNSIPTATDWATDPKDLDATYAYEIFRGLTLEEAQREFRSNVIERCENLRRMPAAPFQFYMIAFKNHLESGDFRQFDSSDSASCFINLINETLEHRPAHIKPIIDLLMPVAEKIALNQDQYEADSDIYGNFSEILDSIRAHVSRL